MVEDFPITWVKNKELNKINNPKTAVHKFLEFNNRFKIDKEFGEKLRTV